MVFLFSLTSVTPSALAISDDSVNEKILFVNYVTLGGIAFDETIMDQLLSNFTNITSQFGIEVSFTELIAYSIGMVIYGFFIWYFYRLLARREMISLPLNKFQTNGIKDISVVGCIFKYVDNNNKSIDNQKNKE